MRASSFMMVAVAVVLLSVGCGGGSKEAVSDAAVADETSTSDGTSGADTVTLDGLSEVAGSDVDSTCIPECGTKECGDDGCGGTCGECSQENEECMAGYCECMPTCGDKECGEDGCGDVCGLCDGEKAQCVDGMCDCTPDCTDLECGGDGCGGVCGECIPELPCMDANCFEGTCISSIQQTYCVIGGACVEIGGWMSDDPCVSCLPQLDSQSWSTSQDGTPCLNGGICFGGSCCIAQCVGRECGDDGCGGKCGVCTSQYEACIDGVCVCIPDCEAKECGSDGCDGNCGICPSGQDCINGICSCDPDCSGKECGDDGCGGSCGSCEPGASCSAAGACVDPCDAVAGILTQFGCEFVSIDLGAYPDPYADPTPSAAPSALLIANPGPLDAQVVVTTAMNGTETSQSLLVPAESGATVALASGGLDGSGVFADHFRVSSSAPVSVVQINPASPAAFASDSSMLLPVSSLGTEYLVSTRPSLPVVSMPGFDLEPFFGYFSVIAVMPGTTTVTVTTSAPTEPLDGYPSGLTPGTAYEFELAQYETLQIQGNGHDMPNEHDLSGSFVVATQPVAVFGGHEEAAVCEEPENSCCADHLEEQLLPRLWLGASYVCAGSPLRSATDKDLWQVISMTPGTTIATDPPVPGLSGVTLGAGEVAFGYYQGSFELTATHYVMVMQFLQGGECAGAAVGDPSQIHGLPTSQYGEEVAVMLSSEFTEHTIVVVRPAGVTVWLDGSVVANAQFESVASGSYEVAYLEVASGYHSLRGSSPVGVWVYGDVAFTGYGHLAGFRAQPSN